MDSIAALIFNLSKHQPGDIRISCTHAFPWLLTFSNCLWLWSSSWWFFRLSLSVSRRVGQTRRMPGSRPKRKRRGVQEEEGSSDSPLTKAAKSCRDGGDEAAADGRDLAFDVDADVDGAAAQKRNWRRTRRVRATHEARIARGALQTIQTCLGRVSPKSAESERGASASLRQLSKSESCGQGASPRDF